MEIIAGPPETYWHNRVHYCRLGLLTPQDLGMSKKNILETKHLDDNRVHVTFDAADGKRTYEYVGSSARAIKRGKTDPSQLSGRLVKHDKRD